MATLETMAPGRKAKAIAMANVGGNSVGPLGKLVGQGAASKVLAGAVVSAVVVMAGWTMLEGGEAAGAGSTEVAANVATSETPVEKPAAKPAKKKPAATKPARAEKPGDDAATRPFEFPRDDSDAAAASATPNVSSAFEGTWIVQGREAGHGRYDGEVTIAAVGNTLEVTRVVHYEDGKTVRWNGTLDDAGTAVNFAYSVRALEASLSIHEAGTGAPRFVTKQLKGRFTVHDDARVLRGYLGSAGDYVEVLRRPDAAVAAASVPTDGGASSTPKPGMVDGLDRR